MCRAIWNPTVVGVLCEVDVVVHHPHYENDSDTTDVEASLSLSQPSPKLADDQRRCTDDIVADRGQGTAKE